MRSRHSIAFCLLALLGIALFTGLGIWQVQRLAWKEDLIARVSQRLAAAPAAAPAPDLWKTVSEKQDEYRRVTVTGQYDFTREVLVQAVTERGAGFWVMTPLTTDGGWKVLVNRGFVPLARRAQGERRKPDGLQTVTGLLRLSQPGGAFLHDNAPDAGRWYSRDTAAIATAEGIGPVAPYFIDAAAGPDPKALPIGGLTVVHFRNAHLSYALTWFAMAIGLAAGLGYTIRVSGQKGSPS